jgi:hypothetical protein
MPCDTKTIPGAILCSRGHRRPKCQEPGCAAPGAFQCDFPLAGRKVGKTCDRHVCAAHRVPQGPDRDYCPTHARLGAEVG